MAGPLAPGRLIFVQYSTAQGEPLHERMILCRSYGSHYALMSPDFDIYTECIYGSQDMNTFWTMPLNGCRPRCMPKGRRRYGFNGNFSCFDGAAGAASIRDGIADAIAYRGMNRPDLPTDPSEAEAEAAACRAEQGIAQPPGFFGVLVHAEAPPAPGAGGAGGAGGAAPPVPQIGGPMLPAGYVSGTPADVVGDVWLVVSVDDPALVPRFGDNHTPSASAVTHGEFGIDILPCGRVIHIRRVTNRAVSKYLEVKINSMASMLEAQIGAHCLPAKFNSQKKNHSDFSDSSMQGS